MRVKKIDYEIIKRLDQIDPDVNQAIRVLFKGLRDQSTEIVQQGNIEKWTQMLEVDNPAEIKKMDDKSRYFWELQRTEIEKAIVKCKLAIKSIEMKQKHKRLLTPTWEFETLPEYQEMVHEDWALALRDKKSELELFENQLANFEEGKAKGDQYLQRKEELEKQQERLPKDIERAKMILEQAKLLNLAEDV